MLHHDRHLLRDVVEVELYPARDPFQRRAALDFFFVQLVAFVSQLEGQAVGRIILQHIEDDFLLDGLKRRGSSQPRIPE